MAERNERKTSKGNEGEEGTDGSKQKGGGGEKEHKRSRLGGAAHYVHKQVTGQPKSNPKKKEGKSDSSKLESKPRYEAPAPAPPNMESKESHKPQGLTWNPTLWQKTPPSVAKPTDPGQPMALASGAVILSTEETESDELSTEGATPPIAMKYDHDDDDDDDDDTAIVSSFVLVPQQSSDDVELSLKLARIEMENGRHKRELKDKERQINEYEEEIILLRTQMSRSGGGGGVQVVVDQSTTQKLTRTIQQLEREKEELMKGKEVLLEERRAKEEELMKENGALKKELEEEKGKLVKETGNKIKKKRKQDIDTLEKNLKALREEAEIKNDAYEMLEAQLKEQEEEIEARVNERLREEVDKHLREAVKAKLTSQKIDDQKKVIADHVKEKEDKVKARYEVLLASKERRIKELGTELEEIMEQLKQKEETEHNLRDEITNLQLRVDAGDGASANNSLSEEDKMRRDLEDQVARVRDLEDQVTRVTELDDHIAKVENDKRILEKAQESLQNGLRIAEVKLQDKDKNIQNLTGDLEYSKALNKETEKLKDTLKHLQEEMASTKKTHEELSGDLSNKLQEIEELNVLLEEKEQEIERLTTTAQLASKEKEQTTRQLREQLDEAVKKSNKQKLQIKELVENMQAKSAIYKQDFESERNDRERIHAEYEELKIKAKTQNKADKEALANLGEIIKTQDEKIRVLKTELNAYRRRNDQNQDEEIQILTSQVNAYSREMDKQKGLLIQSQEKHKTEVSELNEKLNEEIKSQQELACELAMMRQQLDNVSRTNQQLDSDLARLRQQLTNISANNEQLLIIYHEERAKSTRLEDLNEKLKKANKVLMGKVKGHNASTASSQAHISSRRNDVPSGNYYQMPAQASSGPGVKEEEGDEMERSYRTYTDLINEKPQFTAEEMAALFKKPAQPAYSEMESGYDEQEAEKEKKKIDRELEELDQLRRKTPFLPQDPSPTLRRLPKAADKNEDKGRPLDPNLVCPKCGKQYRVGQIQKLRRHMNARCSDDDSDESDEEIDNIDKEIQQMVEQRRKEMQGPSTAEVLFNDDDDNSLPYDPNLVCPKCGKQYRVGEIQKLRRHMNEFCTGIR